MGTFKQGEPLALSEATEYENLRVYMHFECLGSIILLPFVPLPFMR